MSGHCIESEDFVIVVDKWDACVLRRPGCKPHYFFLTHLHADHIKGLTSTWSRLIYTSPFNAWLLPMRRNVKPMLLKEVDLNVTHTIRKLNNEIAFQVTLIDANHCPGAVMFLFQGTFGNILYTGDFRYTPKILENPVLSSVIRNKELNVLYIDNTYAAASCKFPSRDEALKEVLRIIDENPDSKILIGMRQLGKEEVLRAVALHVNEKVCVSNQRLQILSKLEYEDVFTTDTSQSRIHAVELHTITQRHSQEASKTVSIKLTSMYECANTDRQRGNIYIVPYSDHSSHTELKEFVDCLRPLKLYPIVTPKIPKVTGDAGPWYRMSAVNCVIPEEIMQLCGPLAQSAPNVSPKLRVLSNGPSSLIKFHPAPKIVDVEKKCSSVTYIDEGMNILPIDSLGSHLTNNNKARKHIKASWTRLAPKLLGQKGIKFVSSPEKSSDPSQESVSKLKDADGCASSVLGLIVKEGEKISTTPTAKVVDSDPDIVEVPLSDGDDDLVNMPSSARELVRQMNLPSNRCSVNGTEDRRSECSSEITDLFEDSGNLRVTRNRVKSGSPDKPGAGNDSKGSISDVSSTKRTTRSKASLGSVSVLSRPRTRLSSGSQVDNAESGSPKKVVFEKRNLRSSPNAKMEPPSGPKLQRNGLARKSVSLENLSVKSTTKESPMKKAVIEVKVNSADVFVNPASPRKKIAKFTSEKKATPVKAIEIQDLPANTMPVAMKNDLDVNPNTQEEDGSNQKISSGDTNETKLVPDEKVSAEKSSSVISKLPENKYPGGAIDKTPDVPTGNNACAPTEAVPALKKLHNGNLLLSNFNGIHINSPGRRRVPLSCDWNAAQEIAKKETEQALKALETLNQMKGFKTRNVGNRSGLVALRRLSADNISTKSPVKNQSVAGLPTSPTGLRRRTASILSSMATTFSRTPPTNRSSPPPNSVQGISPISPVRDVKKPARKGKSETPVSNDVKGLREKQFPNTSSEQPNEGSTELRKVEESDCSQPKSGTDSSISLVGCSQVLPNASTVLEAVEAPVPSNVAPKETLNIQTDSKLLTSTLDSNESVNPHDQGLFLTDETLASSSQQSKRSPKPIRRNFLKRQNDLNVDLIKLKVGFAMSCKGPKRLSLSSRLSSLRKEGHATSPLQSKEKVQDWKKKISLHMRKSPQRRYRFKSPSKLRENAKRTLATILRSGRSVTMSQEYHADVEDCIDVSQSSPEIEMSGYSADIDISSSRFEKSQLLPRPAQKEPISSSPSVICDSQESKVGILNEVRRSSRLSKEEPIQNLSCAPRRLLKNNPRLSKNSENTDKLLKKSDKTPANKTSDNLTEAVGGVSAGSRFSDRLSEKSRILLSKSSDSVLTQNSPDLLSLMANAFKKSVPAEAPTTANILSSMAENFKKLDEGTKVSSSLSIQLVSSKSQRLIPKDKDSTDWGVQITRVESAANKTMPLGQHLSSDRLSSINSLPKSLSIEIIPESDIAEPSPRNKGPSPPTITISPEVIDLCSDTPEELATQCTIHSLPLSPGPGKTVQGALRWPHIQKSEIESPPPAVWTEKRGNALSGDKVIINIETQEEPQKVPHCPVHCTCSAGRQGTCMGTMRNLIEVDADGLYEVPLSPEDFEDSGAMLALGRGWIEACFEDPEDREEFFRSYEDILPTVSDIKQRRVKSSSNNVVAKSSNAQPAPQPFVRRVLAYTKRTAPVQSTNTTKVSTQAATKKLSGTGNQAKSTAAAQKLKQTEEKKTSSVRKENGSLFQEIEKKIKAYSDEQSKRQSVERRVPSRRVSSQSTSSSSASSAPKSGSSRRSISPIHPPASSKLPPRLSLPMKRKVHESGTVEASPKGQEGSKRQKVNSPTSGSVSPESKRAGNKELERLTDIGKSGASKRYRLSVRRSLDHLMTRQKLRSDRRVKASNLSRS